ncbi:MAG TPA: AraC family transcriptional regulator [Verrucomicrobia bacterium]|nr:AraC family transcriptional regulator [Verrucomicrobiota bacterium]HOP97116.1 AraC family transcriptional regulator [Verrucomicrobiota bacterium]HPU57111.1 AraC family transcriptional regulator [Verrucomicrobiota bacterium]
MILESCKVPGRAEDLTANRRVRALTIARDAGGSANSGRRCVVLPPAVIRDSMTHPLLRSLLPVEVGFASQGPLELRRRAGAIESGLFLYCTRGTGWCESSGRRFAVNAGELVVISPGGTVRCGFNDAIPWGVWWVGAVGSSLEVLINELNLSAHQPACELGQDSRLLSLFDETLQTLETSDRSLPALVCASQTLAHLLGTMVWLRSRNHPHEPDSIRRINQSIAYMNQHLNKPLQVAALAALANMSPSHYTALFKRQTGCAPIDYFIRLKMRRACHLLDETALSVKEIAAALGYDDPFYFSRMFKAVNDVAPSDYRALRRKAPAANGKPGGATLAVTAGW